MEIRVLYFAALRERSGVETESIDLASTATVADALGAIGARQEPVRALIAHCRVAVNEAFVSLDQPLADGDELALIPPVSGGTGVDPAAADQPSGRQLHPRIAISATRLSSDAIHDQVTGPDCGALVTFVGMVRDNGHVPEVDRLTYEAYGPMALKKLSEIARKAEADAPGTRIAIHHRVGTLTVGEPAVVIAAASPIDPQLFKPADLPSRLSNRTYPSGKKNLGPTVTAGSAWARESPTGFPRSVCKTLSVSRRRCFSRARATPSIASWRCWLATGVVRPP